jgi:hypothetical protein
MRTPLLLTALLTVALATFAATPAAPGPKPHTWTDKQGRTIIGDFVELDAAAVTIKRTDGSMVRIARDQLTPQDVAFAEKATANKPIEVKIEASRKRFGTTRDDSQQGQIVTTDQWGYGITVTSLTRRKAENLRADYVLYVQQATLKNGVQSDGSKIHRSGSAPIASLDTLAVITFQTNAIPTKKVELKPGWTWSKTGNSDQVIDTLEGIWLRLYQGDTMIAEYLSSESFRKAGWPKDAPKPPGSGNRGRQGGGS